jgi:aldose sugar dehydrogenase
MNRRFLLLGLAPLALLPFVPWAAHGQFVPQLVPVAKGLDHPWGMAFLPDGSLLVTERGGQLRRFAFDAGGLSESIAGLPEIDAGGQGGLLGIAIDPRFSENRGVFLSFSQAKDNGNVTAVYRARLAEDFKTLENGRVIFSQNIAVPSRLHFGSRLVFDRNENLFVTTGDRGSAADEAQNPASHIGKIIHITREGAPAPDNPMSPGWAPEIWSIGHRNVQGAALHPETGQLWTAEHGARGGDEVNTPQAGKNYGWPVITYGKDYSGAKIGEGTAKQGLEQPLHFWDPSIAPSGMAFITSEVYPGWKGSVLVGALAGAHVSRLVFDGTKVISEERLFDGFGRIRDVAQGPDGRVYVLTDESAPDGAVYVVASPGEVTATTP